MSDYGRYRDETRSRERSGSSRGNSMFDYGGSRAREEGGRGRWTDERENFSWRRLRDGERETGRSGDGDQGYGNQGYGSGEYRGGLPVDETGRLIASNKVEGTAVYGSDGARLGSIYNFMVNKYSGRVEYAVMSYGGFLGMGQRYFPLPWATLSYDTRKGGYRVAMTERDLRDAPSFDRDTEPRFDRAYSEQVYGWYGLDY
jgi:hypothetical protein